MRRYLIAADTDPADTAYLRARLDELGWEPAPGDDWDLNWSFRLQRAGVFAALGDDQRINHYPGIAPLVHKDELHHYLSVAGRTAPGDYDFHPATYSMPWDHDALRGAMARSPEALWIAKPKREGRGRGVALVADPDDAPRDERWIVQRYVADPLLFPELQHKHVLRVYALMTSLDPLMAYVYPNGPVKFAARTYTTAPEARGDPFVHLTNPPVQREAGGPPHAMDLAGYRGRLSELGYDADVLWSRVCALVVATLHAVQAPVRRLTERLTPSPGSCFELVGCDVLVDAQGKPWLLECNRGPSIDAGPPDGSAGQRAQRAVKEALVRDLLRLLGAEEPTFASGRDASRLKAERERRGAFVPLVPGG